MFIHFIHWYWTCNARILRSYGRIILSHPSLTFLVRNALNLWVSKMIWRTRALFLVLGALAQGIGSTSSSKMELSILVNHTKFATRAILAILLFRAILVSFTAWHAFATLLAPGPVAYFSILAISVALAPLLFWKGILISKEQHQRCM